MLPPSAIVATCPRRVIPALARVSAASRDTATAAIRVAPESAAVRLRYITEPAQLPRERVGPGARGTRRAIRSTRHGIPCSRRRTFATERGLPLVGEGQYGETRAGDTSVESRSHLIARGRSSISL